MRVKAAFLLFVLFVTSSHAADPVIRDGNWWLSLAPIGRTHYAVGIFDGMTVGNNLSLFALGQQMPKPTDSDAATLAKVSKGYNDAQSKLFGNVTAGQLADGLTAFYGDYKNRRILVTNATMVVVLGMAGIPKDDLEKMTEELRRLATAAN